MNYPTIENHDTLKQTIDARELHQALGSKKDFSNWVKAKVINNPFFEENIDYLLLNQSGEQKSSLDNSNKQDSRGGHNRKDYALTIDTAKKVSMAEQTENGDKARDYFLQCEKKALAPTAALTYEQIMKQALSMADEKVKELEEEKEQNKPKVVYANAVLGATNAVCVRDWVKTMQTEEGLTWGERKVWKWLEDKGYIFRQNGKPRPYAGKAMEYFTLEPIIVATSKGNKEQMSFKVTGCGQIEVGAKLLDVAA